MRQLGRFGMAVSRVFFYFVVFNKEYKLAHHSIMARRIQMEVDQGANQHFAEIVVDNGAVNVDAERLAEWRTD